jgi:hypothetical protein
MPRMQKMISLGLSTPWNIASSNSPKSHFRTSRRQIISFQGHFPTWALLLRLHPSRFFRCLGCRKLVLRPFDTLKYRFIDITKVAF